MLFSSTPTRTSLKCIDHYLQMITVGRFQMYDYGLAKNLIVYNSSTPPVYPLENVAIPSYMLYGLNDNLVSEQVGDNLHQVINLKLIFRILNGPSIN